MDENETIQKYYNIAFKIKKRDDEFGISQELAYKLIGVEFDIVTPEIIKRHYDTMVLSKFISAGANGIKTNARIQSQYDEWEKKQL